MEATEGLDRPGSRAISVSRRLAGALPAERRVALLHHSDPLLAVEPKVAVGDHGAGLLQLSLGAKDQIGGAANGGSHLTPCRIERQRAGRVHVGEATGTADELDASGLPTTGVGGVLEQRSERLGELGDVIERAECTITGTNGADTLVGTADDDVICAKAGADTLRGKAGDDVEKGGKGRDLLKGGPGADVLKGGPGYDTCKGGKGPDTLRSCEAP